MLKQPPRAKLFTMPRVKDKPKPKTQTKYQQGAAYPNRWYVGETYKWKKPKTKAVKPQGRNTFATLKFPETVKTLAKEIISSGSIAVKMTDNHFVCSRHLLINVAKNLITSTTTTVSGPEKMEIATGLLKDVTLVLQALGIPPDNCKDRGRTIIFKSRSQAFKKSLSSWDYFNSITDYAEEVSQGEEE